MEVVQQMSVTWSGANSNRPGEGLADSLPCEALHLDVEELSEVAEPFNHLGGHAAVKLDSGQERQQGRKWAGEGGVEGVLF